MSIESPEDLIALRNVGRICHLALREMAKNVRPGITTAALADIGAKVMRENGARSAPAMVYNFPAEILISLNEEAVHGIPSARRIAPGDLVKLDVTFEKNGYMGDAAITVPVPPVSDENRTLVQGTKRALHRALRVAQANRRINEIGREIEKEAHKNGLSVIRELGGHGIGRTIHEPPSIANYEDRSERGRLTAGLVITIEPILAIGAARTRVAKDGWTVSTADGGFAAHFEHTLVITEGAPILLTAA